MNYTAEQTFVTPGGSKSPTFGLYPFFPRMTVNRQAVMILTLFPRMTVNRQAAMVAIIIP
jgi:hypothetical protein